MKRTFLAVAILLLAAACHEVPQNQTKSFSGKRTYDDPLFKGDKSRFAQALAARAQKQNEYNRIKDAPAPK